MIGRTARVLAMAVPTILATMSLASAGPLQDDLAARRARLLEKLGADSVAIVRAVLSLAEALGMSTTAEGIETVELATTLATLGCASGQGFYFAKPLEADAALEYWKSRRR